LIFQVLHHHDSLSFIRSKKWSGHLDFDLTMQHQEVTTKRKGKKGFGMCTRQNIVYQPTRQPSPQMTTCSARSALLAPSKGIKMPRDCKITRHRSTPIPSQNHHVWTTRKSANVSGIDQNYAIRPQYWITCRPRDYH
jgi:hypothetical protein